MKAFCQKMSYSVWSKSSDKLKRPFSKSFGRENPELRHDGSQFGCAHSSR